MSTNWNTLAEEHEVAYLRGDLATSSPESYSIDEMKAISDGMFESTAKIDAALKADFESLLLLAARPRAAASFLALLRKCVGSTRLDVTYRVNG